jgi:hypothetical protein
MADFILNKKRNAFISDSGLPNEDESHVVPFRPPLALRGLHFEIALSGEAPAFDFGHYDNLGGLEFIARDETGNIVSIDLDEFFPGEDYLSDPDHERLVKYGELADEESFWCDGQDFIDSTGPWTLHGFSFECPAVSSVGDCVSFPLEKLRFWPADVVWDGVKCVGDAIASGELPSDVFARCEPALRVELRMRGVDNCLSSIPEHSELVMLAREFYEKRFGQ